MTASLQMVSMKRLAVSMWIRIRKKLCLRRWIRRIRKVTRRNPRENGQKWAPERRQLPLLLGPRPKNSSNSTWAMEGYGERVHKSPLSRYGSVSVRMVRYGLLTCLYRASIVKRSRLNNHAGRLCMYVCMYVCGFVY